MSNKTKLEQVETEKPGDYQRADAVLAAEKELADYRATKPGEYQSPYAARLDSILAEIDSRPAFSYELSADPLYRQYQESYARLGQRAGENAAANAAALTGGYANSYAATAAAGANAAAQTGLNEVLPQLYSAAMSRYKLAGDTLNDRLSALQGADKTAYNRWADTYDHWYDYLGNLTDAADTAYKKDYNEYADRYSAWQDWRDYYATESQKDVANALAQAKFEQAQKEWQAEYELKQEQSAAAAAAAQSSAAAAAAKAAGQGGGSAAAKQSGGSTAKPTGEQSYATALALAVNLQKSGKSRAAVTAALQKAGYNTPMVQYALKYL